MGKDMVELGMDLVDVLKQLGVIDAIKAKLVRQPDPALDKLVAALEEVSKIYRVLQEKLNALLSLDFDPSDAKSRAAQRAILVELEGGELAASMRRAKGHSGKIQNIYDRFLSPWFQRVLHPAESDAMFQFFHFFHGIDLKMVECIEKVAQELSHKAAEILDLVDADKLDEANDLIKSYRKELHPQRRQVADVMTKLWELESSFIETSGALGS